jgi:hypothetical protein
MNKLKLNENLTNSINPNIVPYNQKLTNPQILGTFINSLKSLHKQQENKKRNFKKLMNLFSVRVQKYDDSSSHNKTDEKLIKVKKSELANKLYKKRKNNVKTLYNGNNAGVNMLSSNNNLKFPNFKRYQNSIREEYQTNKKLIPDTESNYDKEYEYNSDSSIFTNAIKDKFICTEEGENDESEAINLSPNSRKYKVRTRKTLSLEKNKNPNPVFTKSILNERSKFIKHKFSKQMDMAKSKKYGVKKEFELSEYGGENLLRNGHGNTNSNNGRNKLTSNNPAKKSNRLSINTNMINNTFINIDTSMYNSYKSTEGKHHQDNSQQQFINYYLIKSVQDNKDLMFYCNNEDCEDEKLDKIDNIDKIDSLDHKSRIIYIKPSPKLLSSLSSLFSTSKIVSKSITKNISHDHTNSGGFSLNQTPKAKSQRGKENSSGMNFDHNSIIEKLKNLELMREGNGEKVLTINSNTSESEEEWGGNESVDSDDS